MDAAASQKCHLLSLPKELRLEIWKWTLTDPSVPDLTVNIGRKKNISYYLTARGTVVPLIATWLHPTRNCTIGPNILRANRFIYEEALPLLYHSVKFSLADHQGIFPLWLASLSPYARSLIRYIKLHAPQQVYNVDLFGDPAVPLFHWAVTCAQVAKLSGQLRAVEVDGLYLDNMSPKVRRSILHPLCGIKAKKIFGNDNQGDVTTCMAGAEQAVEKKSALRREQAEARAKQEAERQEHGTQQDEDVDRQQEKPTIVEQGYHAFSRVSRRERRVQQEDDANENKGDDTAQDPDSMQPLQPTTMEPRYRAFPQTPRHRNNRDVNTFPGVVVFQRELTAHTLSIVRTEHTPVDDGDTETLSDGWDIINFEHGEPVPSSPPPSYMSRRSSDSWSAASSTIAEARGLLKDEPSDEESWDIEFVRKESASELTT